MLEKNIKFSGAQYEFLSSDSPEVVFCSGIGGGKTFSLAAKLLELAYKYPGSFGLLSAPTHDQVKTATWNGIEKAFAEIGVQDGVHYVVNTRPPEEWGVKPFTKLSNSRIITWRSGSYTLVSGLDRFNYIRGAEFDYALIDEFRDLKFSEVWKVLKGRMRGRTFKSLGKLQQMFWVSTPPDNVMELKKHIQRNGVHFIQGTTLDNKINLPKEYIQSLSNYDKITYDREVLGKIVDSTPINLFAYSYNTVYDNYISFTKYGYEIDEDETVIQSWDFNVDPITCIIAQRTDDWIRVFKAFQVPNANTAELCQQIKSWIGSRRVVYEVTGDANGFKRDTRGTLNDYQIIQKEFELTRHQIKAPKKNMSIRDSQTLVNALLTNKDIALDSDKDNCEPLDYDLKYVSTIVKDGKISLDKQKEGAHTLDNFRYLCQTYERDFIRTSYK